MNHLEVRTISDAEHLAWVTSQESVSFLQTPAWGRVKSDWKAESIGWFDGPQLVGAALVLMRPVPKIKRYLAYLPEGPAVRIRATDVDSWLDPMIKHLKGRGAFGIRIGPPIVSRIWHAPTIKSAIADPALMSLDEVPADDSSGEALDIAAALRSRGWKQLEAEGGFSAGQPRYNFQIPLYGKSEDDVLAGMNQQWRRNIRKAAKVGVEVTEGGPDDLADFHRVYVETAERDGFTPRPLPYFERMWRELRSEDDQRIRLYLARHEDDLVAATTLVQVGAHAWYSYGASTSHKRDVRGSNAIQWRMIQDSLAAGAAVYDMRGITETIASEDPHLGLIQFKVGTGGNAVEYLGEWDLPINKVLYAGFSTYMKRRG